LVAELEVISNPPEADWFNIKAAARFNPEVRLSRIEGFEPSAQHRDWANPPQADLRWLLIG